MKTSRQLTDLVKNKAERLGISAQILLRRYFMEKFLERISKSKYNKNFVLKGGVLVSALVGLNVRTTQDIDLSIMNTPLTTESIIKVLTEVAGIENDDGIIFTFEKTQNIMEGLDYPGVRVFFTVQMDRIREKIHLDVSTGDKIIPKEIVFGYRLLLEERTIDICAYTVETVLAEKIETILSRSVTNTRARDYYDCYILEKFFCDKINYGDLALAIKSTAEKRNSITALTQANEILSTIYSDEWQKKQWERYQKDNPTEEVISFAKTGESIQRLIERANNHEKKDTKKSKVNLHIHTTYSDGGRTVAEIVDELKEAGITHFAITDHDEVRGNIEATELAKKYRMTHYNGIELSCCYDHAFDLDETYVCHIVGLGFNYEKMSVAIDGINSRKKQILQELFNKLIKDGYKLDAGDIFTREYFERKEIAQEIIAKGYANDADEAFSKILNSEKYKAYAKNVPTVKEGIELIHNSGGLAVWAHPFNATRGGKKTLTETQVIGMAKRMADYGIDGMEVYYQHYTKEQIEFLEQLADKYALKKSIGTDYHGAPSDKIYDPAYAARIREQLYFNVDGATPDVTILECLGQND